MTAEIARKLQQRWRRRIEDLPGRDRLWCYSRKPGRDDSRQGWKIHLSATPLSANDVFGRAWPILIKHDAFFKVAARLEFLAQLNAGLPQFSQIGKFLTVYPRSAEQAVVLARELHAATRGLRGPKIPFDARYRKNSLVYYRYGAFRRDGRRSPRPGTIIDSTGKSHWDKRAPGCAVPRWLDDPFNNRDATVHPHWGGALGPDYLPFRAISQRGKGGVYEAVDLSVSPARLVVIKEGRSDGETAWDSADGFARVKHEGRVLRALRRAGIAVPKVLREFTHHGNRYLVLEKIHRRPLLSRNQRQPAKPSCRRALRILQQLGPVLSQIHAAGWVWRDCKPSHIFLDRDAVRLIDFEGACRIEETEVLPWSSLGYAPPICRNKFSRDSGIVEDRFALGVIAFQFATGEFPPRSRRSREVFYQRVACPDFLRGQIEDLLGC